MKTKLPFISLLLALFLLSGCFRASRECLEPKINFAFQERYLRQLPQPFSPLTFEERKEDWGREYLIGMRFAKELDLYQAMTAFRRAEILAPDNVESRKLEMEYAVLLSYYFGKRYEEVANAFATSKLSNVNDSFPAFHDLLIILYDTYQQLGDEAKAYQILQLIQYYYPADYEKLTISSAMVSASLAQLRTIASESSEAPYLNQLLCNYDSGKKSVGKAQLFNALLPGGGYLYLGQKQTALTAFLVNSLFIAATVTFFQKGEIAAGIITASFEAGWYFGGIYGAAQEAKFYNERLYERNATPMMNQCRLFPALMLNYGF
ncbi:MAG TPA: tetratricopeptide repeat protein [Rhabdochlamydiaceae bacterium]|nr:tetratricopeptide repeat protein [Rhabdochlamydiaceae bacterium]